MSRKNSNNYAYLKDVPQIPDDICDAGNDLTDEQERIAAMVMEAATWALQSRRRFKENAKQEYTPREYATVNIKGGLLCIRSVG